MSKRQIMLEIIPALLIFLFLYAGLSKFLDFKMFRKEMTNQPLPHYWMPFLVWFLPCGELLLAVTLTSERTRMFGLYGSLVLMALFSLYTLSILFHAFPYVPCSCGGIIKWLSWPQHLVLNLFFTAAAFVGILNQRRGGLRRKPISNKN